MPRPTDLRDRESLQHQLSGATSGANTRIDQDRRDGWGEGKEKGAHLEADDVPLLPLHVELVELVELHVEDAGEPVPQSDVPLAGPTPQSLGGGWRRRKGKGGGFGGPQVLDELLEGLVGEVLVPPRRQRLLQVVPEILPELHPPDEATTLSPPPRGTNSLSEEEWILPSLPLSSGGSGAGGMFRGSRWGGRGRRGEMEEEEASGGDGWMDDWVLGRCRMGPDGGYSPRGSPSSSPRRLRSLPLCPILLREFVRHHGIFSSIGLLFLHRNFVVDARLMGTWRIFHELVQANRIKREINKKNKPIAYQKRD